VKAVIVEAFGPVENAQVRTVDDPLPGKGEVCIAVKAAETNFPDILVMEGSYQVKPPLPFSPGKAAAGVVESVGDGASRFSPGDRVAVEVEYGAYAEKMIAPAASCFLIPDGISFEDAAALSLTYQTSHFALVERCQLKEGETVLVLGASGGIGFAAVQLARALGAGTVIAGTRGVAGIAAVESAGADHVIDLSMDNLRDGLRDRVREITGGHGVDVVIDPVGGEANAAALRAMAWRARMVIIGFVSGTIPTIKANYLLVKNISVSGLQWSDYRDRTPDWVANVQAQLFDLFLQGKVKPFITQQLALAEFGQALEALHEGKAQGKIILSTHE
jgi:NADPH2:quinone reductase